MPVPLISGPHDASGAAGRYPSPPAGCLLVAERRHGGFEVILPGNRPGRLEALQLRSYYLVRRRSGVNDDIHIALANDIMVQFRIQYTFALELDHAGDGPEQVRAAAIEAVRYYSRHADPVPLFRARVRQQLNRLSRMVDTSGTGLLYDAIGEIAPNPRVATPLAMNPAADPGRPSLGVTPVPPEFGMRVCLEQYVVSPRPRKFTDAA